jgi:hypothetical protein
MLLPQYHFPPPQPAAVEIAEAAVPVSLRVLIAIRLPEQLQGDVLIGLQFLAEGGVVRLRRLLPEWRCFRCWNIACHKRPSSQSATSDHLRPAVSAAFRYSETVAWPTEQLSALWG